MVNSSNQSELRVRPARENDLGSILGFIRELATFENLLDDVIATEDDLRRWLFGKRRVAEAAIGEYKGLPVAYVLYFHTFSTFSGKPGIYVDDLFVKEEFRGKGIGRMMMSYLAKVVKNHGYERLEWTALNWNERAIRLYKRLGAVAEDEWTGYRLSGEALDKLAAEF